MILKIIQLYKESKDAYNQPALPAKYRAAQDLRKALPAPLAEKITKIIVRLTWLPLWEGMKSKKEKQTAGLLIATRKELAQLNDKKSKKGSQAIDEIITMLNKYRSKGHKIVDPLLCVAR